MQGQVVWSPESCLFFPGQYLHYKCLPQHVLFFLNVGSGDRTQVVILISTFMIELLPQLPLFILQVFFQEGGTGLLSLLRAKLDGMDLVSEWKEAY